MGILSHVLSLGVHRIDSPNDETSRVETTNQTALFFLASNVVFVGLLKISHWAEVIHLVDVDLFSSLSSFSAVWLLVLFCDYCGFFDLARVILVLAVNFASLSWAFLFDTEVGIHHFSFSFLLLPLILFEKHKRLQVALLTPLPFFAYMVVECGSILFPGFQPAVELPEFATTFVWFFMGIFTGVVVTYFVLVLQAQYEEQLDKLRKLSEARAEFLQSMSHEIRTPMSSIIGLSDLLLYSSMTKEPELTQLLKTIHSSGETLLSVVDDILDLAKIEAGKLKLSPASFSLREFVEDVVVVFATNTDRKGLELILEFENISMTERWSTDGPRLRQVLNNLLGNAIKFTEQGEVIIKVKKVPSTGKASEDHPSAEHLLFEVSDSGIGIPEDHLSKLFNNFFQVDQQPTKRYGGTGLGLAICKQLVHFMGGEIGVHSSEGKGSTFWFTIPLCSHGLSSGIQTPTEGEALVDNFGFLKDKVAWVSHPNFKVRTSLQTILERTGLRVKSFPEIPKETDAKPEDQDAPDFVLAPYREFSRDRSLSAPHMKRAKSVALVPWTKQISFSKVTDTFISLPLSERTVIQTLLKTSRPASPPMDSVVAEPETDPEVVPETKARPVVLVAEDNPVNQEVMKMMLGKLFVDCEIAWNGLEVLELFQKQHDFALIFMDMNMPKMNGIEATKAIRKLEEESTQFSRVPIIATTASVTSQDREKCAQAGMDDFLSKPIRITILQELLQRYGLQ